MPIEERSCVKTIDQDPYKNKRYPDEAIIISEKEQVDFQK
jgi:hypothetical protein